MKKNRLLSILILAGVILVGFWAYQTYGQTATTTMRKIVKYTCTMHPEVIMDKPGTCPICGMKLVKKQYVLNGKTLQTTSIPNEVYGVFRKSCMACHGTGGRQIPLSIVDFSKWDQYKKAKQAKLAAAICDAATNDIMPPMSFRKANPNAVLNPVQKELICNWSKTVIASK